MESGGVFHIQVWKLLFLQCAFFAAVAFNGRGRELEETQEVSAF